LHPVKFLFNIDTGSAENLATTETNVTNSSTLARWRIGVIALAVFMLFFQLGTRGLNEPDEGRYAEIGREMAATGDWLVPRLNGIEHLAKPPLTYWLIGSGIRVFGTNEFGARLPAALAALGTLLAVYFLARRGWDDERAALWAVLILLTCIEFAAVARLITTDMILTCFVTASVCCFWRWYISTDRSWGKIVWFYIFLGLAMITKGPVGVVLPLFAVLGVRWRNTTFKLREMRWGKGALVFVIISVPWFVVLAWRQPELWNYFLVRETLERVATSKFHRGKPFWFFVPVMLAGCWPWTPLLPALARTRCETARQLDLTRLCVAWWGLGLLLFTVSHSKLPTYVLPLYAPMAVLLAPLIARAVTGSNDRQRAVVKRYALAIIAIQFIAITGGAWFIHRKYGLPSGAMNAMILAAAIGGGLAMILTLLGRLTTAAVTFVATTCVFLMVAIAALKTVECNLGQQASVRTLGLRIKAEDPNNEAAVLSYRAYVYSLPFYCGHPIFSYHSQGDPASEAETTNVLNDSEIHILLNGPQRVLCVVGTRSVDSLDTLAGRSLAVLEQCGSWTLLSNQPSTP
jgi:4-amino-4-deoxy-L-arabinose transferase-like glycosyltransferase